MARDARRERYVKLRLDGTPREEAAEVVGFDPYGTTIQRYERWVKVARGEPIPPQDPNRGAFNTGPYVRFRPAPWTGFLDDHHRRTRPAAEEPEASHGNGSAKTE